jgi:ATP-dependent Clp protease ATP-binding subunit ClpA
VLAHRPLAGLTLDQARRDTEQLAARGDAVPAGAELPFTARAKKALDLSVREAHPASVEPEHIALGILREGEGIGYQLMRAAAPDVRTARTALHDALEAAPPVPPFHVIELEGSADAWEEQLNDAATEGYELVSIIDRRAVLRLAA